MARSCGFFLYVAGLMALGLGCGKGGQDAVEQRVPAPAPVEAARPEGVPPAAPVAPVGEVPDPEAPEAESPEVATPEPPEPEAPQAPAVPTEEAAEFGQDLLSHSAGTAVLRVSSENNSGTLAVNLLDGHLRTHWHANTDETAPQEAIFELAARAALTHVGVGIDDYADWSAGQRVSVQVGLAPEGPWTELSAFELKPGKLETRALPASVDARYVRVALPARQSVDDVRVAVGEVVLGGTFAHPIETADFSGDWNGGWLMGTFRLAQDGVSLRGCFADGRPLEGTVDGRVAVIRYKNSDGVEIAGELLLGQGEDKPYFLQIFDGPEASDAYGTFNAVEDVECRIAGEAAADEGAETDEAPPADPLETQLETDGKALVYDILFDFNRATLRAESIPILDRIAAICEAHPDWRLGVHGHTDSVGGASYNQVLSTRRAVAVVEALKARGVSASRLEPRGFGMAQPVADNATGGGRARNRRVELLRLGQ